MKKIICILLIFSFFMIVSININAEIIQSPQINQSSEYLCEDKEFNLIKGIDNKEEILLSQYYYHISENMTGYIVDGEVEIYAVLESNLGKLDLTIKISFEDEDWIGYDAYLDEELIYSVSLENGDPTIKLAKEINLYEKGNSGYVCTFLDEARYSNDVIFSEGTDPEFLISEYAHPYTYTAFYIMKYSVNEGYESGDVIRFVVDSDNPISLDEILESIVIEDETDGSITKYTILKNEYVIVDNHIAVGDYKLELMTRDYAGNTTVLMAIVSAYDVTPPTICAVDCSFSYTYLRSEEELKAQFNIEDGATIEIIEDNYTPNYNKLGTYTVIGQAKDSSGNTNEATLNVTVSDNRPPVITIEKNPCISTLDDYSLDDFLKFVSAYDAAEGDYTECVVETDVNNYMNNKRKAGFYKFYITSSDNEGNKGEGYLTVKVIDSDYPLIKADEYTIIVKEDYTLTREEIIAVLKSRGQIIESSTVEVKSNYFNDEKPNGLYTLDIIDSSGNQYSNTIEIFKLDQNVDYSPKPKNEEDNKDYTMYYIFGGIAVVLIGVCTVLLVIKQKKRH